MMFGPRPVWLLLLVAVVMVQDGEGGSHSWRYVFPFFPAELDVLLGHLRTTVVRLKETLDQCKDMAEGEYDNKDTNNGKGVQKLNAPRKKPGNSMEDKVEHILSLREQISELEDEIEECRFYFWTGKEV